MAISGTTFTVDGMANTASVDILVGGEVETIYSYGAGGYTLSERDSEATIARADLAVNYRLIVRWREQCVTYCSGFDLSHVDNSFEIENEENTVKYKLKIGGTTVIDAEKNKATDDVTFAARSELTMNSYAFGRFIEAIRLILFGTY